MTVDGASCASCDKLKRARDKALSGARHETAGRLSEALERHRRSAHPPQHFIRKETLSERVAAANALSRKAADRW
ncbi:hypothetical protein ACFP1Z_28120 [Streptomyces gamaensis]|uniref:Integrase n=1 Tax=Streptomyces gamaensis TaxID=1763542 RepID=A0ABW0Z5E6_9ACTN